MAEKIKKVIKVAFQGKPGAYSEEAAYKYFKNTIKTIGYETFEDVFTSVVKKEVDYGIIPVENSIEGTVRQNYELFLEYDNVKPCSEVVHRIKHCLISLTDENLKTIKVVYSHPQALGQCSLFLKKHKYKVIPFDDTAGSIKMIKEKNLKHTAGIASERAGKIYGMKILKKGIENNPQNFTRFLIIAKEMITFSTGKDKTSLIFSLKHSPGSLFMVLRAFVKRKINLTKIESIPVPGEPWKYNFLLDFEGHLEDKKVINTLEELKKETIFAKIIGSYPRANSDKSR